MKAINNFENVQATTGEFNRPAAGGYIVEIINVKDVPINEQTGKGDYLVVDYDIAVGEYKGYYGEQNSKFGGDRFANFIRSYKEKALGMFKHFTNCVEESNPGFVWDWNEKRLIGKFIGVVLQEEEYPKKDGSIGTKLKVKEIKTVEQIKKGDFKIPPIKKVEHTSPVSVPTNTQWEEISSDDSLPF